MSNPFSNNNNGFKLSVPALPARSTLSEPDHYAARAIDALDAALAKPIWPDPSAPLAGSATTKGVTWKSELQEMLKKNLVEIDFSKFGSTSSSPTTLETVLDKDSKTSLFLEVEEHIGKNTPTYNAGILLGRESILQYLFADAIYGVGLSDPAAIAAYICKEESGGGLRRIYERVVEDAVKDYVDREKIEVGSDTALLKRIRPRIQEANYSFTSGSFEASIRKEIEEYAFDKDAVDLIDDTISDLGLKTNASERSYLVNYFKQSGVPLTKDTKDHVIPIALTEYRNSGLPPVSGDSDISGALDASVTYFTESHNELAVNRNNVLHAAQLFYVMVLGDELGVFNAADLLMSGHWSRMKLDFTSSQLNDDLGSYFLDERFPDLKNTSRFHQRTSAEERRMFYRQVFNYGDSDLMEGMVTNTEFESLWNVLMIETVKYIDRVAESERPESHVSRNNIQSAIEDLQYNLSSSCSGMVKSIASKMNKELNFVMTRIFSHPEVLSNLPTSKGSSSWSVIESLLEQDEQHTVNSKIYQKKAEYGHRILSQIANYDPTMITDDGAFSGFISLVEAFIITNEQLEDQSSNLFDEELPVEEPATNGVPVTDDWNF